MPCHTNTLYREHRYNNVMYTHKHTMPSNKHVYLYRVFEKSSSCLGGMIVQLMTGQEYQQMIWVKNGQFLRYWYFYCRVVRKIFFYCPKATRAHPYVSDRKLTFRTSCIHAAMVVGGWLPHQQSVLECTYTYIDLYILVFVFIGCVFYYPASLYLGYTHLRERAWLSLQIKMISSKLWTRQ